MEKIRIIALIALLLLLNIVVSGCISEDEGKDPITLKLWGGKKAKIYAGDTKTYVIKVINNREKNDTVNLSVSKLPSGWDVTLNQTTINLTAKASWCVFLVVNSSQDAKTGDYKIRIKATSAVDGKKNTYELKTTVIAEKGERVEEGDKVEVDYIGYLTDYRVFDTSNEAIGEESGVRKTPDFGGGKVYEPLKVYVGPEDLDDSDEYISTVEGFWEATVGMREDQSRTVVLPPKKAYGDFVNTTVNVTEEVRIFQNITFEEYRKNYLDEPTEGTVSEHYWWGWNITLVYVNESEDVVRMINEPDLNQTITAYGWESKVIYKNQSDNGGEGRILLEHDAETGMEAVYHGFDAEVISVENDQIHLEYNQSTHNLGQEVLVFDITLIKIED